MPGSVRYTALPWEWLGGELRGRSAALTTVLLDLVADREAWPLLQEYGGLPAFACAEVYGVVSPPSFTAGGGAVSGYTRQWIEQLRRGHVRPANVALHALAAGTAALAPGTLVVPTARELGMRPASRHPCPDPCLYPDPDPALQAHPDPHPEPAPHPHLHPQPHPGPYLQPHSDPDPDLLRHVLPLPQQPDRVAAAGPRRGCGPRPGLRPRPRARASLRPGLGLRS